MSRVPHPHRFDDGLGRRERPPSISIPEEFDHQEMIGELMLECASPHQQVQGPLEHFDLGDLSPLARELSPIASMPMTRSGEMKAPQSWPVPDVLNTTDLKMLLALSPAHQTQNANSMSSLPITPKMLQEITPKGSQLELHPGWSLGFWDVSTSNEAPGHGGPSREMAPNGMNGMNGTLHNPGNIPGTIPHRMDPSYSYQVPEEVQPREDWSQNVAMKGISPRTSALKWGGKSPAAAGPRDHPTFSFHPSESSSVATGVCGIPGFSQSADAMDFPLSPLPHSSIQSEDGQFSQSHDQQQLHAAQEAQAQQAAAFHAAYPHDMQAPPPFHMPPMQHDLKAKSNKKRNRPTTPSTAQAAFTLGLDLSMNHQQLPDPGSTIQAEFPRAAQVMPPMKHSSPIEPVHRPKANGANNKKQLSKSQTDRMVDAILKSAQIETTEAIGDNQGSPRVCNCKKTRCLKLYCECFAAGSYCTASCNCTECSNNSKWEPLRAQAIRAALSRNPEAFSNKFEGRGRDFEAGAQHRSGCRCKKSACLKKYCECFMAEVVCGDNCRCVNCQNFAGSEALKERRQQYRQQEIDTEAKRQRRAQQSGAEPQAPSSSMHAQPSASSRASGAGNNAPSSGKTSRAAFSGYSNGTSGGTRSAAAAATAAAAAAAAFSGSATPVPNYPPQNFSMGFQNMVPMMNQHVIRPAAPRDPYALTNSSSGEFAQMAAPHR